MITAEYLSRVAAAAQRAVKRSIKGPRKPRNNEEEREQMVVVEYLRQRDIPHFATISGAYFGGNRGGAYKQSTKLKAMGWEPGTPDLIIKRVWCAEDGATHPVAIEMKSDGGVVTQVQREVHRQMRAEGWVVLVCHGSKAAIAEIRKLWPE